MKCDAVSPFLISKTRNNGPFKSRHFFFPVPFCSRDYTLSCSSFNNLFLDKHNSPFEWRFQSLLLSRSHLLFICGLDFSLDWNFIHLLRGLNALVVRTSSSSIDTFLSETSKYQQNWCATFFLRLLIIIGFKKYRVCVTSFVIDTRTFFLSSLYNATKLVRDVLFEVTYYY